MATTTLKKIRPAKGKTPALWLVIAGDRLVGLLEKYRNTRTETHPWKAFKYVNPLDHQWDWAYLGAYYENDGGKQAAINAILSA